LKARKKECGGNGGSQRRSKGLGGSQRSNVGDYQLYYDSEYKYIALRITKFSKAKE
jgi:hypothetical protein